MESLGSRLKDLRQRSGLSLRELARQVDVSPSFVSQIENGKSQPSVATLYAFSQRLNVSIDELFEGTGAPDNSALDNGGAEDRPPGAFRSVAMMTATRSTDPAQVWRPTEFANRISVVHPAHRSRLGMADGVVWERLAATPEQAISFMKIVYAPGACSTDTAELSRHSGYEYGYVTAGCIEVTVGDEVFVLSVGESIGFDSTIPHMLRNPGDVEMQGIWFVHGGSAAE